MEISVAWLEMSARIFIGRNLGLIHPLALPGFPEKTLKQRQRFLAERQIEPRSFAPPLPCREIARDFDRVEELVVHRDHQAEQSLRCDRLIGVKRGAAAVMDHLCALGSDRLANLVAHHTVERVIGCGREGLR